MGSSRRRTQTVSLLFDKDRARLMPAIREEAPQRPPIQESPGRSKPIARFSLRGRASR